jgi:hypothetical protein
MHDYLIVANQTLGGRELDDKVQMRLDSREGRSFYVVVPRLEPEHEVDAMTRIDPMFSIPGQAERTADAIEEARRRSEHRLDAMISRIENLGGEAQGELGVPDPYQAAKAVIERFDGQFLEVIVSTLPPGLSRWVKMDLASRLDRLVACPVTVVEAEG